MNRLMKKKAADANSNEEFLDHKSKKRWVDNKSGHISFMLYARSLYGIPYDGDQYWTWKCFKETSDENIEVAKLLAICWLDISGKLKISDLSAGVVYEIAWVVKLTNASHGWERPVTLRLSLPDGKSQERKLSLLDKPIGQWLELHVGNFKAEVGETGEVSFNLMQIGGQWKHGLIIKAVIFKPKI